MLSDAIRHLILPKYNGYKVYAHNLSKFDGVFLLPILAKLNSDAVKVSVIKRDNLLININIKFGKCQIDIRDSLLMLPGSLRELAKSFGIRSSDTKGIFPYNFVSDNLDYIGPVPSIKFFSGISRNEYEAYSILSSLDSPNSWNLREETIKYCLQDCKVLYKIIVKFNTLCNNKFKINIHKFPTLPSLAYGIFRASYLKHNIPILVGDIYDFIRESYTGGSVDVFKPSSNIHIRTGTSDLVKRIKVYCYDVNSLYPFVMSKFSMPTGIPKYFKCIQDFDFISFFTSTYGSRPYGFFRVEVTAPDSLEHPILQTKVKTKDGFRTMSPLGTWTGVIFSEELYNAEKFGYRFNIIEGYLFDKANVFDKYIKALYQIKQSTPKSDPMYFISKLLMNSLYGRFGMDYKLERHQFMNNSQLTEILQKEEFEVNLPFNMDSQVNLVSYLDKSKYEGLEIDIKHEYNVSIGIASAISAYARVHMSQFKNNPKYILFYTDTDSIYVSEPLIWCQM